MLKNMLTNTETFMYLFYLPCVLRPCSSPPSLYLLTKLPKKLQTKFLSTQL